MTPEEKKQLVRDFSDALILGDADVTLGLMSDDPVWVFWGEARPGVAGVRSILEAFSQLYRRGTISCRFDRQYVDGDVVISQMQPTATTFEGEPYENRYVSFTHLEGRKIAKVEEYLDTAYAAQKFSGWQEKTG